MTINSKKLLSKLISKTIGFVSILIILVVLIVSLLKLFIPYWIQQEGKVTDLVESYISGEVNYKDLKLDWSKFHPVINIKDLSWNNDDKSIQFESGQALVEVNLWSTLWSGYLVSESIELDKVILEVNVDGKKNESVSIHKIKNLLQERKELYFHKYLKITDTNVLISSLGNNYQQKVELLQLKQVDKEKQLLLETHGELLGKGRMVIETIGELFTENSAIDFYSDLNDLDLTKIGSMIGNEKIAIFNSVNSEQWLKYENDEIHSGRLNLANDKNEKARVDIAINLSKNNVGYNIKSEQFIISLKEGEEYKQYESNIDLQSLGDGSLASYNLSVTKVPVEFLKLLVAPVLDDNISKLLGNTSPKGIVDELQLSLETADTKLIPMNGFATLSDVSVEPYENIPGFTINLLELHGANGEWLFELVTKNTSIQMQPMFKEIIPVTNLTANGRFDFLKGKELLIDGFNASNKDASVKGRGKLSLDNDFAMTLYAEASRVNIARLYRYWPRDPGFKPKALKYLDESLIAGKVDFAKFIWQGKASKFPFMEHEGQFNIQAKVSNADYRFHEDWPAANRLYASASFENERIDISASSGEMLGAKVSQAHASIENLKAENLLLKVNFDATTNHSSYQSIFEQSPLKEKLGDKLVSIIFDNNVNLNFDLGLLISEGNKPTFKGLIEFQNNNVTGIPYEVEVDALNGNLSFTENGAYSENLQGDFLGSQMTLSVKVNEFTDNDSLVQIDASGLIGLGNFSKQILQFSPLATKGKSLYSMHYQIDDSNIPNESLILRSTMRGTSIQGPPWIGKTKEQESPLLITMLKKGDAIKLRTSYRDQISSELNFIEASPDLVNGIIKIGDLATADLQKPVNGVSIEGYFDEVDLKQWIDSFNFGSTDNGGWPAWIDHINVTTPKLIAAGQLFTNVRINDEKAENEELRVNFFSEQARANFAFFPNGNKQLNIEHLNIRLQPLQSMSDGNLVDEINLSQYDDWQLECKSCTINGYEFGPLKINSDLKSDAVEFNGSAFVSDQLSAVISGSITNEVTNLGVKLQVPNPSGLLDHWGLQGDIKNTTASVDLNLHWPGSLHDFSLDKNQGSLKISGGEGVIENLSDKKARIFSLFSLQSIPRRLSLDFTDLFKDGFFYDKITGNFEIKNGVLISDKVEIKGVAADVSITGEVNLIEQTVDQTVLVTPKLGSSLPVLAGWAIEPTTGLIMLIVSKIFEPALNVVSSIKYKITGNLEDPQVVELSKQSKEIEISDEQIEQQKLRDAIENLKSHGEDTSSKTEEKVTDGSKQ